MKISIRLEQSASRWSTAIALAVALVSGSALAQAPAPAQPAAAPAAPPSWQQGRSAEQSTSTLHPFAPIFTGRPASELPLDTSLLNSKQWVADLVYHPLDTALLSAARDRGARTIDGLGMLVFQAARQFTIWTGLDAPVVAMRTAALEELERRRA